MLRVTGILIGSALAVAVLIIVLGMPEFGSPEPQPVKWQETPAEIPDIVAAAEVPVPPPPAAEPAPEAATEQIDELPAPAEPPSNEALVEAIFAPVEERPVELIQENWYAFWSPFRSEIAANGFVEQLQRTTGLDYRVVKQKPGVYEVAFAYDNEADIQAKLDTIAAATGLEMPGG